MFPYDILHQRHPLFAFKKRRTRTDVHLNGKIVVMQQHQHAFDIGLRPHIRELFLSVGLRVRFPRSVFFFSPMVGNIVMFGNVSAQIVRNLPRAGRVQMLVCIKAVRRIVRYLIHADEVDIIHAVFLGDIVNRVGVHLLFL